MMLSAHFSLEEFTTSETARLHGLGNQPPPELIPRLRIVAERMETVRTILGNTGIAVHSGYRCEQLNELVGGVPRSAHSEGWAVDWTAPRFGAPLQICHALAPHLEALGVDQMIEEGTWVHLSFKADSYGHPRHMILTRNAVGSRAYRPGLRPL